MIIGTGLDLTELERIRSALARHGERFAERILTEAELALFPAGNPVPFLAARFAAKEAAFKALGTGMSGGVTFHTVEVLRLDSGAPQLRLLGAARDRAEALGARRAHVSLTHGRDVAAAVVILED